MSSGEEQRVDEVSNPLPVLENGGEDVADTEHFSVCLTFLKLYYLQQTLKNVYLNIF